MADDPSDWMAIADNVVVYAFLVVVVVVVCYVVIHVCTLPVQQWWHSPRMRLFRLGGVTTLRRKLNYDCGLCQASMNAGDKVRTLSCNHAFHCGGSGDCERDIDRWLLDGQAMSWKFCPICRQIPYPVLPWKRPPPSSPAPSTSTSVSTLDDLEAPLLHRAHDETLPEASSSAPAPPLAQSPPTSAPSLKEALLPPAHDETLPEASSSAPAPPLAQSPPTSTPGSKEALLPSAHDETLSKASSSAPAPLLAQSSPTLRPDSEVVLPLAADDEIQPDPSSSQ